jgi:hypothetical protein
VLAPSPLAKRPNGHRHTTSAATLTAYSTGIRTGSAPQSAGGNGCLAVESPFSNAHATNI